MNINVDYIHNGGYWDGPLNGKLRARGRYYYFDLAREDYWRLSNDPDEGGNERFYDVYRLRREIMARMVKSTRLFCHNVGWHQSYRPGENRRLRQPKPGWMEWIKNPERTEDRISKEEMMDGAERVGSIIWPLKFISSKSIDVLNEEWRAGILAEHPTAVFL